MAEFYTKFIHETFDQNGQVSSWSYDYPENFNYGYDVIDLGVNCDTAKYDNAVKQGADIVACSSLLTTTMPYMKEVVEHFKGTNVKVIIGGAPVTQAFADEIGADGYSEDASEAVALARRLVSA